MTTNKTKIAPPKREKPSLPPVELETSQNLHKEERINKVQMKFDVSHEFRREFKLYATEHDMTMGEVFEKAYEFYRAAHP